MIELIQGSAEWHQARCGSLGASCVHEVVAKTKTGFSASRANRMACLIVERLTGIPQDSYQNQAMLDGIEREPDARIAYEFYADAEVAQVGLVCHPTLDGTHASPDGLVGDDGLVEIKCPQPAAHLATLLGSPIPDKYVTQMLWQMRCADRAWCDFASYNPQFPEAMRLLVKRVYRDDKAIADIETLVSGFLIELEEKERKLRELYGLPAVNSTRLRNSLAASLAAEAAPYGRDKSGRAMSPLEAL